MIYDNHNLQPVSPYILDYTQLQPHFSYRLVWNES
jgi:hypothetical protein